MLRMSDNELLGDRPVQRLVMGEWRMRGFSFDPTWIRTLPAKLAGVRGVVATLGLILFALTSPSHAQAPPWGRRRAAGGIREPPQFPVAQPAGERVRAASGGGRYRRRTGGDSGDELVPVAGAQSDRHR